MPGGAPAKPVAKWGGIRLASPARRRYRRTMHIETRRRTAFWGLLACALVIGPTAPASGAPLNDNLSSATRIAGLTNFTVSNAGATAEALEPSHAGEAPSASLWWRWTAPVTGTYCILTSNSVVNAQIPLDTVVAVYTGTGYDSLRPVVANDDTDYGEFGAVWSRVVFRAYEGEVLAVAIGSLGATGTIRVNIAEGGPLVGPWEVPDLDGRPISSTAYVGRTVMIDFWETTCAACVQELPDLLRVQDVFGPQGFTFLGLSGDPTVKLVTDYLATHPVNYPIGMSTPALQQLLNGSGVGYPTKFLIDPSGRVVGTYLGGNTYKYYRSVIDPVLRADSRPHLTIAPEGDSFRVAWSADQSTYGLQVGRAPNGPWFPAGGEKVVAGNTVSVMVPGTNTTAFYRVVGR